MVVLQFQYTNSHFIWLSLLLLWNLPLFPCTVCIASNCVYFLFLRFNWFSRGKRWKINTQGTCMLGNCWLVAHAPNIPSCDNSFGFACHAYGKVSHIRKYAEHNLCNFGVCTHVRRKCWSVWNWSNGNYPHSLCFVYSVSFLDNYWNH